MFRMLGLCVIACIALLAAVQPVSAHGGAAVRIRTFGCSCAAPVQAPGCYAPAAVHVQRQVVRVPVYVPQVVRVPVRVPVYEAPLCAPVYEAPACDVGCAPSYGIQRFRQFDAYGGYGRGLALDVGGHRGVSLAIGAGRERGGGLFGGLRGGGERGGLLGGLFGRRQADVNVNVFNR